MGEVREALKNKLGPAAIEMLKKRAAATIRFLEDQSTWGQFGTMRSLSGPNFLSNFYWAFLYDNPQNLSLRKKPGRAISKAKKGFKAHVYELKYLSKKILRDETTIDEIEKLHSINRLKLSWYYDWFKRVRPVQPKLINRYVYVDRDIPGIVEDVRSRSRTGQGIMVIATRFRRSKEKMRGKTRTRKRSTIPSDVQKQLSEGGWRLRITTAQRNVVENMLKSRQFAQKVRGIIMRAYRKAWNRRV